MRVVRLLFALIGLGCTPAPTPAVAPTIAPPASSTAAVEPAGDVSYFPLVAGAVYEYDAVFGDKRSHERRIVRAADTAIGRVFYFVDAEDEQKENPSIGTNAFGLGVYRVSDDGLETADVYFLDELPKVTALQFALRFPIEPGATTTLSGGKKLETKVIGPETITVPAGTFACIRLNQREIWTDVVHEGSVWLARGVGMVKRIYVTGRTETLTAYRLP